MNSLSSNVHVEESPIQLEIEPGKKPILLCWKMFSALLLITMLFFLSSISFGVFDNVEEKRIALHLINQKIKYFDQNTTSNQNEDFLQSDFNPIEQSSETTTSQTEYNSKGDFFKLLRERREILSTSEMFKILKTQNLNAVFRDKRKIDEMKQLEIAFRKCKNSTENVECLSVYKRMYKLVKYVRKKMHLIEKILKDPSMASLSSSEEFNRNVQNETENSNVSNIEGMDTREFIDNTLNFGELFEKTDKKNQTISIESTTQLTTTTDSKIITTTDVHLNSTSTKSHITIDKFSKDMKFNETEKFNMNTTENIDNSSVNSNDNLESSTIALSTEKTSTLVITPLPQSTLYSELNEHWKSLDNTHEKPTIDQQFGTTPSILDAETTTNFESLTSTTITTTTTVKITPDSSENEIDSIFPTKVPITSHITNISKTPPNTQLSKPQIKEEIKNLENSDFSLPNENSEFLNPFERENSDTLLQQAPRPKYFLSEDPYVGGFQAVSGPFINLCEKALKHNAGIASKSKSTSIPENSFTSPSPSIQFTSLGPEFPVTSETAKATAQVLFNPNFGMPTVPLCFFATPMHLRTGVPIFWTPNYQFTSGHNSGTSAGFRPAAAGKLSPNLNNFKKSQFKSSVNFTIVHDIDPRYFTSSGLNSGFFYTPHISGRGGPNMHHFSSTNNAHGTSKYNNQQQSTLAQHSQSYQPMFCTYMANSAMAKHGNFGIGGNYKGREVDDRNADYAPPKDQISYNIPLATDIVYATYPNQMSARIGTIVNNGDPNSGASISGQNPCPIDSISCFTTHQCIPKSKWCDSSVDCMDASDEATCSCKSRIGEMKICDGYPDCPMGEDEMGCFGCDKFMYSCYESPEDYRAANKSIVSMCYSSIEKCDGIKNCLNGNDEKECSIIVDNLGHHLSYRVSYTEGFLHRNYKGRWYPVCENSLQWARQACETEIGILNEDPEISFRIGMIPGPFIQPQKGQSEPKFLDSCKNPMQRDIVVFVQCPEMKCGRVEEREMIKSKSKSRRILNDELKSLSRRKRKLDRVVGGAAAKPSQWPFIVAIYRDGRFHCGGVIYNRFWIITAAHCVLDYPRHYYEVRVGMLRRSSFSAITQTFKVSKISGHENYERLSMKNDLALLKLDSSLRYNRWIRPICMPEKGRTSKGDDWIWAPENGTVCTAVGWGAIREKGLGSEELLEVEIPIMGRCKQKDDQEAEDICAGELNGGRDACQGDSGGPLLCRSVSDTKEWYLAGIISHGEGCARPGELGVYTRVALYLDWIDLKTKELPSAGSKMLRPRAVCPGFTCIWGGEKCIGKTKRCNRVVDCLGGEDEVGCRYNRIPEVGSELNRTTVDDFDVTTPFSGISSTFWTDIESTVNAESFESTTVATKNKRTTIEFAAEVSQPPLISPSPLSSLVSLVSSSSPKSLSTLPLSFPISSTTLATLLPSSESLSSTKTVLLTTTSTTTSTTTQKNDVTTDRRFSTVDTTTKAVSTILSNNDSDITNSKENLDIFGTTESLTTTTSPRTTGEPTTDVQSDSPEKSNSNRTDDDNITNFDKDNKRPKFVCKRIHQKIDMENRCDNIIDCEDGTDEIDCTCREFLKGSLRNLICDGETDCNDLTDEKNCGNCSSTEYFCSQSQKCIENIQRCDGKIDCEFNEDELHCFSLSDGKNVIIDPDGFPNLQAEGILTRNENGSWRVVCTHELNEDENVVAKDVCLLLGFTGLKSYNATTLPANIQNTHLIDPSLRYSNLIETELSDSNLQPARNDESLLMLSNCKGLYIECNPHPLIPNESELESEGKTLPANWSEIFPSKFNISAIIDFSKKLFHHDKKHKKKKATTNLPWLVDIFVNGEFKCKGVLLDKFWIVSEKYCVLSLKKDYVTVLLGGSLSEGNKLRGPYEHIERVSCIKDVQDSNVQLLYLAYPIQYNRRILPTFLPSGMDKETASADDDDDDDDKDDGKECLAIIHNNIGVIRSVPVVKISDKSLCMGNESLDCYEAADGEWILEKFWQSCNETEKDNEKLHHHAIFVCSTKDSGWYPEGFFSYDNANCNLQKPFTVQPISKYSKQIQNVIDYQKECDYIYPIPICSSSFRCPLGNCLPEEKICNGKNDCHDGSDENAQFCHVFKRECDLSEFKCKNGNCVLKSKFCDHINDCGDLSDEPTVCSCYTYLQATDPGKICDGIPNCWDKSDESPGLCNCTDNSFRCERSGYCIPNDFVCDKEPDCPYADDERSCNAIEYPINTESPSDGYGQLIEQSYGIWHTKCFPRQHPPNVSELQEICQQLENNSKKVKFSYRFVDDDYEREARRIRNANGQDYNGEMLKNVTIKYKEPTKVVVINKFSPVRLNNGMTSIFMKPSRPLAQLIKWDVMDSSKCYRLEIKCESEGYWQFESQPAYLRFFEPIFGT